MLAGGTAAFGQRWETDRRVPCHLPVHQASVPALLPPALRPNTAPEMVSQVLQRPLDVDTVQHALPHEVDQVRQQVSELRKQVFELEEHLGNRPLLPALDKVALGREVGALC